MKQLLLIIEFIRLLFLYYIHHHYVIYMGITITADFIVYFYINNI